MPRNLELLLTENVDALGIVGDVVHVRSGYARNFLLPRGLATKPSEEAMKSLAAKRAEAERQLRELRAQREAMVGKLTDHEVTLVRSCNDQGLLYGSVTQKDIADALVADGFNVTARDVRLGQTIKRVDTYHVLIKLDKDLDADVKVWVVPDRELPKGDHAAPDTPAPEEGSDGAEPAETGADKAEGAPHAAAKKPRKAPKGE